MAIDEQLFPVHRLVVELHGTERVLRDHVVEHGVRDVHIVLFRVPVDERRGQVYYISRILYILYRLPR